MQVDPSVDALKHALDVSGARHTLLAENLANLNTPGYGRVDLDFEAALKDVAGDPTGHGVHGGTPTLEHEAGTMAVNDSFYAACTRLLSLRYQMKHASLKER